MKLMPMLWVISIHAPTRGATSAFNASDYQPNISIHAPTRGATIPQMASKVAPLYFNPRSYKRSDVFCNAQVFCAMLFQSTLLQEERQKQAYLILMWF